MIIVSHILIRWLNAAPRSREVHLIICWHLQYAC